MADVEAKKNDHDDDDSLSSSDSDDDAGPPPMIQIERSADLGQLKSALFENKEPKEKQPKEIQERLGKDVLSNITSNFEKPQEGAKIEKEKIAVDKEQYSSFKQKFEHLDQELAKQDEDRRKDFAREDLEIGAEILKGAKAMFEQKQNELGQGKTPQKIDIERSDADRKRVKETFYEPGDKEEPRDCAVCGKMVYPVEKVLAEKRVFHKACFKCHTCQKPLSVQGYTSHEGKLYCKLHITEIYRPEVGLAHEGALDADTTNEPDDDEEYAVVSKSKVLDPSVVRSGMKTTDDLENVGKLQAAKAKWAESAEQSGKTEKRSGVDADLIQQGKVKSRLTKYAEGGADESEEPDDDEEDANRDPNIIRSTKKKEAIQVETGAKSIKSKWDSGTMERAQGQVQDRSEEMDEIKKNVSVKERFKERTGQEESNDEQRKSAALTDENLDTTFTKSAKDRFMKGEAFQDTTPVEKTAMDDVKFAELGSFKKRFEAGEQLDEHTTEKTAIDVRCAELGNIKAAFESAKNQDQDQDQESKKKHIQEEFERIKNERQAIREKELAEGGDAADGQAQDKDANDIRQSAEMGSIKKRFEEGTAFQSATQGEKKPGEQLEIKVAGKAREKFKQIDQEAPKEPVINQSSTKQESKWAKEKGAAPEPINRRAQADETGDEEPEEYEVKNILSKFKNIEQGAGKTEEQKGPRGKRQITPPPEGYRAEIESEGRERDPNVIMSGVTAEELASIKVEAKNLKEKFEKVAQEPQEGETAEEKRHRLEEEFKRIKEMKDAQPVEEPEPEEAKEEANPDLAIAAEHAQKAKAKWDKIQRKEAKKAQKAAAVPQLKKPQCIIARTPEPTFCVVCTSKVYQMEKLECDGRFYHRPCFKCAECGLTLRLESYAAAPNGCVYCRNHYKTLFNNMARPLYDGRHRAVVAPVN